MYTYDPAGQIIIVWPEFECLLTRFFVYWGNKIVPLNKGFCIDNWHWQFLTHYVHWDFDSKNTSHLRFLQEPFILDVCKPLKEKLKKFYVGPRRYSHLSILESHGQARINLKKKLGYNINFLSIWPFMRHPCFPTIKVSKVSFFLS